MKKLLAVLLTLVFCLSISGLAIADVDVVVVIENDGASGSVSVKMTKAGVSGSVNLTPKLVKLVEPVSFNFTAPPD